MDEAPSTSRSRKHRENLSQADRESQREKDRLRKAAARKRKSEEKAVVNKKKSHAEVVAGARENETVAQTAERRRSDRIRAQSSRAAETVVQTTVRQQMDALRHRRARVDFLEVADENMINVLEDYCGPMSGICDHCEAKFFDGEKNVSGDKAYVGCCHRGNIKLRDIETSPLMESLLSGTHRHSKNFKENIRSFNSSLAFASVGATLATPPGHGPYCFRIQGQIYHRAGTLHPINDEPRKFAQLYILDPDEAAKQRSMLRENNGCSKPLMAELSTYMASIGNPYVEAYKMLHEVEIEAINDARMNNIPMPDIHMAIKSGKNLDRRRYNCAKANEVAIVFQGRDGEAPKEQDLLIHLRSNDPNQRQTERISILNPKLEPMAYPILFPFGDQGWAHKTIPHVHNPKRHVTHMEYYAYRFQVRSEFNPYLRGGRLTQQFFVDAYVKVEGGRLNYVKFNQSKLRTDKYSALADHLNCDAAELPGRAVILPSSFGGSPRNMQQRYQDAMAIVRKYGKPDLFVTMTCNPAWREIKENLNPHETSSDRPDLVARVFNLKLKKLLNELQGGRLGKQLARVHVIEFQKRGLPHAHILLILRSESKPNTPEIVDKLVKAEIPDQNLNPRLYEIVTKHMVHGPCGILNPESPCMDNGKCGKEFPKQFCDETNLNAGGYPKYKRRNDGTTATVSGKTIDNRWIVPYNPYLLQKFNCHINVEVCATIKSVKYLFKYVYKGHDCANVEIREQQLGPQADNYNEVKSFVDSRYVSPPEAAWRIFSYPMHEQSHTVSRLTVHLPEQQSVQFDPRNLREAVEAASVKDTTLTAYFKLNEVDPEARQYLYHEIPEHYLFEEVNVKHRQAVNRDRERRNLPPIASQWQWRKRIQHGENIIGRMYTVSMAADIERYCLRVLLLHVKGSTSFEDLRTINGVVHESFEEAAEALGLLESPVVWEETISDAVLTQMPRQVREVFATVCLFGSITKSCIKSLFQKYKEELCQDFTYRNRHPPACTDCVNQALLDLQSFFVANKKTCADFGLPTPITISLSNDENQFVSDQVAAAEMYCSLNDEQLEVFEEIYDATLRNDYSPKCYFLDGPGGAGKTFVYETLIHTLIGEKKKVLAVASTGVAANLLPGGRTSHSQYGIPVPVTETSVSTIKPSSKDAEEIRQAKLLIWDESTMASSKQLSVVDQLLREIVNPIRNRPDLDVPFGGKVLLLGGDFRQTLPIVKRGSRTAVIEACIKQNKNWDLFKKLSLKKNVRSVDPDYSEWLLKLGNGDLLNSDDLGEDIVEIPGEMVINGPIEEEVFGTEPLSFEHVLQLSKRAVLCPTNADVNSINQHVLDKLDGEEVKYLSVDSIDDETQQDAVFYPTEFLNDLHPSGMPPHVLKLKKGSIVMLLRNLNTRRGLCNGTRVIVTDLKPNLIIGQVLTGSAKGNPVFIPRIHLVPTDGDLPFVLRRRQFPVNLAFAMTINKSQGQTFEKVGIFLPEPVFGHGQLYVAFSRVKRSSDVKVKIIAAAGQGNLTGNGKTFTKNIVFKEIL